MQIRSLQIIKLMMLSRHFPFVVFVIFKSLSVARTAFEEDKRNDLRCAILYCGTTLRAFLMGRNDLTLFKLFLKISILIRCLMVLGKFTCGYISYQFTTISDK